MKPGIKRRKTASFMWPSFEERDVRKSWTNGDKADVHLVVTPAGEPQILKIYRPGFTAWMFREYLTLRQLFGRSVPVPQLRGFKLFRRELLMSFVPGERVLEWGLREFGGPILNVEEFQNANGLYTDPRIGEAFRRLKESQSPEAAAFRAAVQKSYHQLHALGWQHGTSDPRNVIYDGTTAYLIDFDHARPSLAPARADGKKLDYWFGVTAAGEASRRMDSAAKSVER
jgi:Lipopolysaccharide kinase (Kdo/WaaP) family